MNFLDICKRLRQEAGYSGSGPTKVTGQTGEMLNVVTWAKDAWLQLQKMRSDWRFMLKPFEATINQGGFTAQLNSDFRKIKTHSVVMTRQDGSKSFPTEIDPEEMRQIQRESQDIPSYPRYFAVDDAGLMTVFPSCNESVSFSGDYYRAPVELAENTDVPHISTEHHIAIVWLALITCGAYEEASNTYQHAKDQWTAHLSDINRTEKPKTSVGGRVA